MTSPFSLVYFCINYDANVDFFFQDRAQEALNFVLDQLAGSERSCHTALVKETSTLCKTYPALFSDKVLSGVRHRNNNKCVFFF